MPEDVHHGVQGLTDRLPEARAARRCPDLAREVILRIGPGGKIPVPRDLEAVVLHLLLEPAKDRRPPERPPSLVGGARHAGARHVKELVVVKRTSYPREHAAARGHGDGSLMPGAKEGERRVDGAEAGSQDGYARARGNARSQGVARIRGREETGASELPKPVARDVSDREHDHVGVDRRMAARDDAVAAERPRRERRHLVSHGGHADAASPRLLERPREAVFDVVAEALTGAEVLALALGREPALLEPLEEVRSPAGDERHRLRGRVE